MNILKKTQNAVAAWLSAQNLGTIPSGVNKDLPLADFVYLGMDNATEANNETQSEVREIPCVECQCDRAEAKEYGTGNYTCHVRLIIKGSLDDMTDDEFESMADTVCNFIETTTISDDLTAALANYTAHVVRIKEQ